MPTALIAGSAEGRYKRLLHPTKLRQEREIAPNISERFSTMTVRTGIDWQDGRTV
jgi:hypothetical protein